MKLALSVIGILLLSAAEREIMQDQFYVEGDIAYAVADNQPFTGAIVYIYEKAGVQSKRRYHSGHLHGISESWYLNQNIEEQVAYVNNQLNGIFKKWHRNGQLYAQGQYTDGNKSGTWAVYDEGGKLVNELTYAPPRPAGSKFVFTPPKPPS